MMRNLKDETLNILAEHGKTEEDVYWIGCTDFRISPSIFWRLADRLYDSGFGGQEVASDLLIVGYDWWLERHEYDGSEWWEYKTLPAMPQECKDVDRVIRDIDNWWSNLYDMNFEES